MLAIANADRSWAFDVWTSTVIKTDTTRPRTRTLAFTRRNPASLEWRWSREHLQRVPARRGLQVARRGRTSIDGTGVGG